MKIVINLPPRTKKNSQRIIKTKGHYAIIPSQEYKLYESACRAYMPNVEMIDSPVNVKCLFYMPTQRRVDLTNLLEAIDDILVKYKVLLDDNYTIIVSHDGSRVLYDKEHPRTEIEIEEIENDETSKG